MNDKERMNRINEREQEKFKEFCDDLASSIGHKELSELIQAAILQGVRASFSNYFDLKTLAAKLASIKR